jgi:two-component system, chemotaxis family, response regulator Rcp1
LFHAAYVEQTCMNTGPPRAFRILLVEDNAADVYLFEYALENADVTVEWMVMEDGGEALDVVRRQGKYFASPIPDLVVLDLNLPTLSGVAVLEALRQNADWSHVPVAIVSSSATPSEQARVKELDIQRYITKPSVLEEFLHVGEVLKEMLLESNAGPTPTSRGPEGEE